MSLVSDAALSRLSLLLLAVIAGCAFILSFSSLMQLAIDAGVPHNIAWLWPVLLDSFVIVVSITLLMNKRRNGPTLKLWICIGAFTFLSTLFNVIHAPANLVSQAVFGLPPIVLFLSVELIVSSIPAEQVRPLPAKLNHQDKPLPTMSTTPQEQVAPLQSPVSTSSEMSAAPLQGFVDIDPITDAIITTCKEGKEVNMSSIARSVNVSRQAVQAKVSRLVATGILVKDSSGIRLA